MSSLEKYGITMTEGKDEAWGRIGGVSPKVMGSADGTKVLIKCGTHDYGRDSLAEYFAYNLGQAIGVNVNKVKLIDCGILLGLRENLCSVHTWEEDFTTAGDYGGTLDKGAEERLALFDEITYNDDRHGGNYGILDGELFCIDHGFSEPWCQRLYDDGKRILRFAQRSGTVEMVEKFMALTPVDFSEMAKIPSDLEVNEDIHRKSSLIVDRMVQVQDLIRNNKEMVA